jgi:anti-sigma factor ChrR (cupin superfamily)
MEKLVGEGVGFERIRRVTGYLSGDVKRFNNGKRAEEKDRVKHSGIKEITKECECECKNEN